MKPWFTILLLLLCCAVYAQTDSLAVYNARLHTAELQRLDSLHNSFTATSDSIRNTYTGQVQKLASLRELFTLRLDSIKSKKPSPDNPLDTINTTLEADRYTKKLDSIDHQLAGIQRITTAKLDSLKGSVTEKISKLKLPKGAKGKAAALTSAMDKVNVPAFNTGIAVKSGLNINTALPNLSGNVPNVDLPGAGMPDIPGADANLPGMGIRAPDLKSSIPQVSPDLSKVTDLTGQAGQVQQATASQEALGKTLEGKAAEQLKGLPQQTLDTPSLPGGLPTTGDQAKEQVVSIAKKQAVNHFAGKEQVLMSAMEKMGKYKQKYSSVSSLKDIKDQKPHNEMKSRPLRERLVPALTLQFQSWHDLMLDINPSMGYKLNSHLVVGLGWNQRIAFNVAEGAFNRYSNVHGFRSYAEYTLKKGFGFRADLECMNTPLKQRIITDAPPDRAWVWSAMVGIKQKYPIYKKLKGNAQLMYNLFDKDHRSPYTDRINWRIGLEFTLRKKRETPSK